MHNVINKSEIIDLYNVRKDITMYRFPSKHDLYMFLGQHNHYLDNIYLNSNYVRVDYYEYGPCFDDNWNCHISSSRSENIREYMFIDGYGRILDPRDNIDNVNKIISNAYWQYTTNSFEYISYVKPWNEYTTLNKPRSTKEQRKKRQKQYNQLPVFRRDPIPHISHNKVGRPYYRHQKTFNERKQNADPEVYEYVRPCRRHNSMILNPWDNERTRPWNNKSWKDCTKKRKQWM